MSLPKNKKPRLRTASLLYPTGAIIRGTTRFHPVLADPASVGDVDSGRRYRLERSYHRGPITVANRLGLLGTCLAHRSVSGSWVIFTGRQYEASTIPRSLS